MKHKITLLITAIFVSSLIFGSFAETAKATDEDLAEQYKPWFYFEKEETCYPVDVSYALGNSYLYQYTDSGGVLVDDSPTAEELAIYSTEEYKEYYLDNQRGSTSDDGIITDYQSKEGLLGYTAYARVYTSGSNTVIQYWMYYAFNKGTLNVHEGDWEMVQIVLTGGVPTEVMYSQHYGGQKATWEQVEKSDNHIKVYVARGSHANYLRSYSGVFGAASDFVGANGKLLSHDEYNIELLESQGWLDFSGRWGAYSGIENAVRGSNGPSGPMYREDGEMWNDPIGWGNSLSQADNNGFLLEWFLCNFLMIFILLMILSFAIFGFLIYRRHKKHGLGPRIFSILYIDGGNIKTIGNILCIVGIIIAFIALIYPWYCVSANIGVGDINTGGFVDLIRIDGVKGIEVNLLDDQGPRQMGTFTLPFSLFIGIGLVFLILGTIGISHSKKLGRKYLFRGIKLMIPIIILLIAIMALGMMDLDSLTGTEVDSTADTFLNTFSNAPFGGQQSIVIPGAAMVSTKWGLCLGGQLLLLSGLIIIIAGIMELAANTQLFTERVAGPPQQMMPPPPKKGKEK